MTERRRNSVISTQKSASKFLTSSHAACLVQVFIIHPCNPTVVICYLIWACDIAVHITYLISHSSSLSSHSVIKGYFWVGCIINTKLPSCVDIIRSTSLGFHSWCPESTHPTDSCFQDTSCENLMMYGGLYQHTRVVLYISCNNVKTCHCE